MCGFVFVYAKREGGLPSEDTLGAMDRALAHRGPDEHGSKTLGRAMLAHRRLRVIDLTGGQQPMSSPDGRVWIVFNGEIYNYRDVLAELRALGHRIAGASDTEVLLTAYLEWGDACVHRLNGMFAFVVYDGRAPDNNAHDNNGGRVFAARDRFGEKPLYVYETADQVYFASELKALAAAGVLDKRIDPVALYSYFTTTYVIGPRTIFKDVSRLQPGHALSVISGSVKTWPYWQPPRPSAEIDDERDAIEQTRDLLRDAVRLRLVGDVPIGFFLSGGVDSSIIVAIASEIGASRLNTFGLGFEEELYDERPYQRYVAERFGTHHHELVLKPQGVDVIEQMVWHLDEPFADSAALPVWFLAEDARASVTVALSGDGGDEMFAGYDTYRGHMLSERLKRVPGFIRAAAAAGLRRLPARDAGGRARRDRLARNIQDVALPARARLVGKRQKAFRRQDLLALSPYLSGVCAGIDDRALFPHLFDESLEPLEALTLTHQTSSLPDDMLVKIDRMSMAHSLELRAPFLDHRIAELANRMSFGVKLPGGRTKSVLKKAMAAYFPEAFAWRRKQGLDVPLAHWFKDDLHGFVRDRLLREDAIVPRLFDRAAVEGLLGEHAALTRDRGAQAWTLLMFEMWCQKYDIPPDAFEPALGEKP